MPRGAVAGARAAWQRPLGKRRAREIRPPASRVRGGGAGERGSVPRLLPAWVGQRQLLRPVQRSAGPGVRRGGEGHRPCPCMRGPVPGGAETSAGARGGVGWSRGRAGPIELRMGGRGFNNITKKLN